MERTILLIDDEIDFLTLMKKRVESWGYQVIIATNGDDALALLKKERPSAIILDYTMPDINGVDLLRKIRAVNQRIPAIMFTAQLTIKAIEGGTELNVAAFIPKVSSHNDTEKDLKTALELVFK
jgi:DNA-binding NtrC family response regulator